MDKKEGVFIAFRVLKDYIRAAIKNNEGDKVDDILRTSIIPNTERDAYP